MLSKEIRFGTIIFNMLVNRILKHRKKNIGLSNYLSNLEKYSTKDITNPLYILRQAIRGVTPDIEVKVRHVANRLIKFPLK
ncbi:hypothetical protein GQ457_03G029990 [Hibiscus cannabinus]